MYDNLVCEVIQEDVLDELLDAFYTIDITIPPEVVTKQLYEFYIKRVVKSEEEETRYMRKINYLINKHQNTIVKTWDLPKNKKRKTKIQTKPSAISRRACCYHIKVPKHP